MGPLPAGLWDVDLSNNQFNGKMPNLVRYTNLESFVANNNNFSGELPGMSCTCGCIQHVVAALHTDM